GHVDRKDFDLLGQKEAEVAGRVLAVLVVKCNVAVVDNHTAIGASLSGCRVARRTAGRGTYVAELGRVRISIDDVRAGSHVVVQRAVNRVGSKLVLAVDNPLSQGS